MAAEVLEMVQYFIGVGEVHVWTLPFFHHCQASEFDMSKIAKTDGKVNVDGTLKDELEILTMSIFSIR